MASILWQKEFDFGYQTLWPRVAMLDNGGVAVAFTKPGLTVQVQLFDANGSRVGNLIDVGTTLTEAWQTRANIVVLNDGNIAVFTSDLVHAGAHYSFDTRLFFSVVSPEGQVLNSGDIRAAGNFIGMDVWYQAKADGTVTVEAPHAQGGNGVTITGIGAKGTPTVSQKGTGHSGDPAWKYTETLAMYDQEVDKNGVGYEAHSINKYTTMILTKQSDVHENRPLFGYVEPLRKDDILKSGSKLAGTGGNDRFSQADLGAPEWKKISIDGGAGIDTVTVDPRSHAKISKAADGLVYISSHGEGGPDIATTNVERIEFSYLTKVTPSPSNPQGYIVEYKDTLALDVAGNAGQAYRLYQAALDRTPDTGGLGHWIRELDRGTGDLLWMARNFIGSAEFKTKYGAPETVGNQAFLTLIYQNVLDRAPDASGIAYWVGEMEKGMAREQVLAGFSESAENKANTAPTISDGIWYV